MLATVLVVAGQRDWIEYHSREGRYSVSVPGEPKLTSQERTTPNGKKLQQYLASVLDGTRAFIIGYYDYPASMTFSFETARDEMVNRLNGRLLSEELVRLDGVPASEIRILAKTQGGTEIIDQARFTDIKKRVYLLQCIFPKDEDGPAVIAKCNRFTESFKLTGQ